MTGAVSGRLLGRSAALVGMLGALALPSAASALVPTAGTQLPGSGGSASVAISGDTAIQGAGYTELHSADVFHRSAGGWSKVQTLTPPAPDVYPDDFGRAVALDGTEAAVSNGASVYVYANVGGTWTLQQQINAPADDTGQPPNTFFGWVPNGLSLSGNTLVVGDLTNNGGAGTVWIYTLTNGVWTQTQELGGPSPPPGSFSGFGGAVAVRGDEMILGAAGSGLAYIYRRGAVNWNQEATITRPPLPVPGEPPFGASVAIQGDTAAVGMPYELFTFLGPTPKSPYVDAAAPAVFVYAHVPNSTKWPLTSVLTAAGFGDTPNAGAAGNLGVSTAIDGSRIVSGGYVYTGVPPATWAPFEALTPPAGTSYCGLGSACYFGRSVGISGTTEIVNAGPQNAMVYP